MEISEEILKLVLYGTWRSHSDISLKDRSHYLFDTERLQIPRQVRIYPSTVPGNVLGVFAVARIKQGTEMGPFVGTLIPTPNLDITKLNSSAWELFDEDGAIVGFVDGGGRHPASWLSFVQCARCEREQNLEVFQVGRNIYYRAMKDIEAGDELLVWYGPSHTLYMGLPCVRPTTATTCYNINSIPETTKEETVASGKLRCVLCRRGFNSRSNLRSHMRIHTLEKPFICKFCGRRFSQSSTLRNHVRLHTGEKPYKCLVCRSSYSQLAGLRAHQRSSTHRPNK